MAAVIPGSRGGFVDLAHLVTLTGLSDPVLRLISSLLIAYPLALFYRVFLYRGNPTVQHIFFTATGLSITYYCYGLGTTHSVVNITLCYLLLLFGGPTTITVVLSFILNMGYLLLGYTANATGDYDVDWTTPHCVLCLRLISLTWNYYDGHEPKEILSPDKTTALKKLPSILEVFGNCYFCGGCVVGPLFPIKSYIDLVEGKLIDKKDDNNSCIPAGFLRFLGGIAYLGLHSGLAVVFSNDYLLSDNFQTFSYWNKMWIIGVWGRVALMKYLGVWLTSEGSCIISGLGYNGKTEDGKLQWDGLRNMKLSIYEVSYTYQHIVDSFNINTNKWVFKYCFKRLRFLGNKHVSHFLTLMFLALWHGIFIGYFFAFFMEFLIIIMEKQIFTMCVLISKKRWSDLTAFSKAVLIAIQWPIRFNGLGYCAVPFCLLSWDRIHRVYSITYYTVPAVLATWFILYPTVIAPLVKALAPRPPSDKEKLKKAE
ncbi:lysophospholipid acyltransferase 5 [Nematostella vectensis]|uniref:lysophospholipid acyltransferase 5 n=1 Tax=Nematostella vectensis TaxID=45351 RepID=UPI0013902721|nr:lysophospholipid acyltransferase 5 [Nematostella vectensis]